MRLVGVVVDRGEGRREDAERKFGQPKTDPKDEGEEELNDGPPDPPRVTHRKLVRERKFAEENKGRIVEGVRRRNVKGGSGG
jgi:hypothetical protein